MGKNSVPNFTWHDVVKECEQILGCEDTAESALMSNLPNLVRDLKNHTDKQTQLTRPEIWLKAWIAVASANNSTHKESAISWADSCLQAMDKKFDLGSQ